MTNDKIPKGFVKYIREKNYFNWQYEIGIPKSIYDKRVNLIVNSLNMQINKKTFDKILKIISGGFYDE